MKRRGFFKSLLGVLALPFAKDIVKELPKRPSEVLVHFTKTVPVYLGWNNGIYCWEWSQNQIGDLVCHQEWKKFEVPIGKYIPMDEAFDIWSGT